MLDVTDAEQIAAAAERVGEVVGDGGLDGARQQRRHRRHRAAGDDADRGLPPPDRGQPDRPGRGHPGDAAAIRRARGRVVFVSSIGGRMAFPLTGAYHAAKFGLEAVGDVLRQELRPWGIEVLVIEPGSIDTPIWERGERDATRSAAARRGAKRSTAGRSSLPQDRPQDRRARDPAGEGRGGGRARAHRAAAADAATWSGSTPRSRRACGRWSRRRSGTGSSPAAMGL